MYYMDCLVQMRNAKLLTKTFNKEHYYRIGINVLHGLLGPDEKCKASNQELQQGHYCRIGINVLHALLGPDEEMQSF